MSGWTLFVAVFLACLVEAVEALTIVLAAGTARQDWRSAMQGVSSAVVVLAAVVAALGPALTAIPLHVLRLFVGGLLLVFGLQWLRKAVLRASRHKPVHDEDAIFRNELDSARNATTRRVGAVTDWYGFTLSFKGVLLEGLEVAFIVVTFGSNQHDVPLAALAAGCAVALVLAVGLTVRAPLSRVPENSMKFVVGILLTGFGTFWGAEGADATWPHGDAALPVVISCVAVFALGLVALLRRVPPPGPSSHATETSDASDRVILKAGTATTAADARTGP